MKQVVLSLLLMCSSFTLLSASPYEAKFQSSNADLVWCIERSMDYALNGDFSQAVTSFISDIGKSNETKRFSNELTFMILINSAATRDADFFEETLFGFDPLATRK